MVHYTKSMMCTKKWLFALYMATLPVSVIAQTFPQAQIPSASNVGPGSAQRPGGSVYTMQTPSAQPRVAFCKKPQVVGVWKMEALYEVPVGEEQQSFSKNPERYLELGADSSYYGITGTTRFAIYATLRDTMKANMGNENWQYVVDEVKGQLHVFRNRELNTTYYCGIATEAKGGYNIGDMILTPATKSTTQVFRQYRKITLK